MDVEGDGKIEKKNNGGSITIIIILLVALLGVSFYVVYDKTLSSKENNNEVNDKVEEEDTTEITDNENSCIVGTYYGEASGTSSTNSFINYNYKYTYTFNADGTFTADFNGVSGASGTYVVSNGFVMVIHPPEIGTPGELMARTHKIADDCSYITYDSSISFNLYKQQ